MKTRKTLLLLVLTVAFSIVLAAWRYSEESGDAGILPDGQKHLLTYPG